MDSVGIRKVKRRVTRRRRPWCGRWQAYVLGEDWHGRWLYTPAGSLFRGSDGETTGECEVGQGNREGGLPVVSLVPPVGWWFATWHGASVDPWMAVDICTPATLVDGEYRYVDLELDPHRTADGQVWIDDECEFAAACRAGIIPPDEEAAARTAADEIERRLRLHDEPFGDVGWRWLARGMATQLPPLTELI